MKTTDKETTMTTETTTATAIPATRADAIALLVEQDCERWGEGERHAARRLHGERTYGRALTELANRAELADKPDAALRAAAKRALTATDRYALRQGG